MSRVREKTWDDWQQPESEAVELVRCFSRPGDLVADPTFGTGTVAAAVARVGGRRFLGCDLREDLVALACRRVDAALRGNTLPR